jgi:plasmid stabilization system protein ParE
VATVTWLPEAIRTLDMIRLFIQRDSEIYADLVNEQISRAAQVLADFPESGRIVPEFGRRDVRELIVRRYRLVYRLRNDNVEIVAVLDRARRIDASNLPL